MNIHQVEKSANEIADLLNLNSHDRKYLTEMIISITERHAAEVSMVIQYEAEQKIDALTIGGH